MPEKVLVCASNFYYQQSNLYFLAFFFSPLAADSDCGFNLIVIDPPWENGSARQKSVY